MTTGMRNSFFHRACTRLTCIVLAIVVLLTGYGSGAEASHWPYEIASREAKIVIYEPQIESYKSNKVTGRAAISVTKKGEKEPVFGAVWLSAGTVTDRESRMVGFTDVKVERIHFPNLTPEQEKQLQQIVEREGVQWEEAPMALDQFLALVAVAERERAVSDRLSTDPPKIIFTAKESVLIIINGKPVLRDVGSTGIQRVVNTPYVLLYAPSAQTYYLKGGDVWFSASDISKHWEAVKNPPGAVVSVAREIADRETASQPQTRQSGVIPEVIVATEPTELIQTDGELMFGAIRGTDLLYLTNSDRDVFLETRSQQYYIVLAGRWYRSKSLEYGPWTYVEPDKLPATFYQIPPDSEKGYVLAFVAGTFQAEEAVMDAQIPQTAAIKRSEARLAVTYDGAPQFERITGTDVEYAVNTSYQVLRIKGRYYACSEAVWFFSDGPHGPWIVADSIPREVGTIPPDSPVYNVKYVRIYDATPEVVYVGYTPGYFGSYVYGGTVVYGTGYWYPGYFGPYGYYPAPITWGVAAVYDPFYGYWGYGAGFYGGAFWGFTTGVIASAWWYGGTWWHHHHDHHDHHRHRDVTIDRPVRARPIARPPDSYSRPANVYTRASNVNKAAAIPSRSVIRPPVAKEGRPLDRSGPAVQARPAPGPKRENNVFADRDGNIFRRTPQGWEQRDRGSWSRPETREGLKRNFEANRPSLERDFGARTRGMERSDSFQRFQGSGGSRGPSVSGSGARGGGIPPGGSFKGGGAPRGGGGGKR